MLLQFRALVLEMARRDIVDQYAGQVAGAVWAIAHPLYMAALYVVVFGVVFKVRIPAAADMPYDYTAYVLAGLFPWLAFNSCMTKACSLFFTNANLVKQVVFPLEVLPAKTVLSSLLPQAVGTVALFVYVLAIHGYMHWTYVLLPVLVLLQVLAMLGIAFLFSSISTFFRDLKDFVQIFGATGVYLMPAFYLPAWVPGPMQPLLYANPFSYMTWCYQDVLYYGRIEHPIAWIVFPTMSLLLFAWGFRVFQRVKPHLGDVL